MLKTRIITACVLVLGLSLELLELSYNGFVVAMSLIFVVAAWEWANMAGLTLQWQRLLYAGAFAALMLGLFYTGLHKKTDWLCAIFFFSLFGWFLAFFAVYQYPDSKNWSQRWLMVLAGVWLLIPAWIGLLYLQPWVMRSGLIWLVIAVIATADIGAYFSGRRFGRRKLALHVSPGKTWEGFWGGVIANVLLATAIAGFLELPVLQFLGFIAAMVSVAVISVLGDLFESMVKRERGIKDSSQLLPGHGGVLDRIDGWTAAVPLFTLLYLLFGQ